MILEALMGFIIAGLTSTLNSIMATRSDNYTISCVGLRQAMGTFGALMGSIIAGLAYSLSGRNYAVTFSLSALPALGALLLVTTVCCFASALAYLCPSLFLP